VHYIILAAVFLLLAFAVASRKREEESYFWGKLAILFLSVTVTFEVAALRIPLGIILAFLIVAKMAKTNVSVKLLTLSFALVAYVLVNYLVPPIGFGDVLYSKEIHTQMNRFTEIEYVKTFASDAAIQTKISVYDPNSSNVMFRTYVLLENNVPIKDKEWLLYSAHRELDQYWQSRVTRSETVRTSETSSSVYGVAWEEYVRDNRTGTEYVGFFEKEGNEVYLKYVIKGKLGTQPLSLFERL
jgi:hypothetical protein